MIHRFRPFGAYGLGRLSGDPLVSSMAAAIRQMEGYNPNFAANNNPGNLVYVGQSGATMGAGGFAKFPTPAAGEAALEWQIQNYINRGYDLTTFFNTYAPGNTKNAAGGVQTSAATQNYINTVSSQLGIDPSIPLNSIQGSYGGSSTSANTPDDSLTNSPTNSPDYFPDPLSVPMPDAFTEMDPTAYVIVGAVALAAVYLFS